MREDLETDLKFLLIFYFALNFYTLTFLSYKNIFSRTLYKTEHLSIQNLFFPKHLRKFIEGYSFISWGKTKEDLTKGFTVSNNLI